MKPPCEIMVKHVLPVFRAMVAENLINEHGLTQTEAANKLGITQAAISQYLREKRGHSISSEKVVTTVQALASEFADKLASPDESIDASSTASLCKVCPALVKELLGKAAQDSTFLKALLLMICIPALMAFSPVPLGLMYS